jgi:phosphoglycolate phosphatase
MFYLTTSFHPILAGISSNFLFLSYKNALIEGLACIASKRGSQILGQSLSGDEILVIGDTPLDIACAQSINARVLAVATGGHPLEELQACSPTWALESLAACDVNAFCK